MFKTLVKSLLVVGFMAVAGQAQADFMQVQGVRSGDTLNVRTGPGARYQDIGDLQPNEVVRVLGYDPSGKWAQVRYRGQIAYVSAAFLAPTQRSDSSSTFTGPHRVTGIKANDRDGGLVVRMGAGTNFDRAGVLPNGTRVNVVQRSRDGKWGMIHFGGGTGWVSTAYLTGVRRNATSNANMQGEPEPMPYVTPLIAPDGTPLPATYVVTGLRPGDFLNLRNAPRSTGNMIGRLPEGIEVQVMNMATGDWAYVDTGVTAGYVNFRYLANLAPSTNWNGAPQPSVGQSPNRRFNGMVIGIDCQGTEPYWTLDIANDRTVSYNQLIGGASPPAMLLQATPSSSTGGYPFAFNAAPFSGTINAEQCTDGMSDVAYNMSLVLQVPNQSGGVNVLYGCCNVRP